MSDNLIKKNYESKIKLFQYYNKYYYEKSDPKISDQKFDDLKKKF